MPAKKRADPALALPKTEALALEIAIEKGVRALRYGLGLEGYDEPDLAAIDVALARLMGAIYAADGEGDVRLALSAEEAAQLEIAADTGFQIVRALELVQNTRPMEAGVEKLKALAER